MLTQIKKRIKEPKGKTDEKIVIYPYLTKVNAYKSIISFSYIYDLNEFISI